MLRKENPVLGIVIPCFNEGKVIQKLYEELKKFASVVSCDALFLFVDDGSSDDTFECILKICNIDKRFAALRFSRNFGHQVAVSAGLRYVKGDIIAVLDADLQDPLEVILEMLEKWRAGYDVVYGIRQHRKEKFFLKFCYTLFYRILTSIASIKFPLDAGDFSLMDRKVVDLLNKMPEHNRFVRGLRGWVGFKQIGIPYERRARAAGLSKYRLSKLMKLALDGIMSFSALPLRFATICGVFFAFLGFAYLFYVAVLKLFMGKMPPGWTSLVVIIIFFNGIQLLVIGILGEYIAYIFEEVKNRPQFIVQESVGWLLPAEKS